MRKQVKRSSKTKALTSALNAAFEEKKNSLKTAEQLAAEKAEKEEAARKQFEYQIEPFRIGYEFFETEVDRLAYNLLVRYTKIIFDYKHSEYYELDFGQGKARVLLAKVTKKGEPIFHALKHTKGFLAFVSWVRFYNGFEKECTAQSVCEGLKWVLRYGKDKDEVVADEKRRNKPNTTSNAPSFAHSLTTPLGYVNKRAKRSLESQREKRDRSRDEKRLAVGKQKQRINNVVRLLDSTKVMTDVVLHRAERDVFKLRYEMMKGMTRKMIKTR